MKNEPTTAIGREQESQNIEWKESWRDEYLKWICGFANAQGGKIYIGKNDTGEVVGIKNATQLLEEIPNKVKDILGIIIDVNLLNEQEKTYLEIVIEAYPYPISYKGQYHYRSGSTKQELKGAALDKFLLGKTGKRWDSVPVPNVPISALSREAIAKYKQKAVRSKRVDEGILTDTTDIFLEDLNLIEDGRLKRAAILLFHPNPEKFIQGAYVKIGFFNSHSEVAFQDVVSGSLIQQIQKLEELLSTKYTIYTISYQGITRVETPPFPDMAIREALLNAIAHKDYSDPTPIQISVYSDRIVFWNPGQLPENWTVENLKKKHASRPFNPAIAHALFRCGDIEAWGRGTLNMIKECILHKTLPPEFEATTSEFTISFFKDIKTALTEKNVAPQLIKIVAYVIEHKQINNSIVQNICQVSKPTASRYLTELEGTYLDKIGGTGKGTVYVFKGLANGS
jgi:ATP-dependent DNA helicase RecG